LLRVLIIRHGRRFRGERPARRVRQHHHAVHPVDRATPQTYAQAV